VKYDRMCGGRWPVVVLGASKPTMVLQRNPPRYTFSHNRANEDILCSIFEPLCAFHMFFCLKFRMCEVQGRLLTSSFWVNRTSSHPMARF
jgi:hypothetical protein